MCAVTLREYRQIRDKIEREPAAELIRVGVEREGRKCFVGRGPDGTTFFATMELPPR